MSGVVQISGSELNTVDVLYECPHCKHMSNGFKPKLKRYSLTTALEADWPICKICGVTKMEVVAIEYDYT